MRNASSIEQCNVQRCQSLFVSFFAAAYFFLSFCKWCEQWNMIIGVRCTFCRSSFWFVLASAYHHSMVVLFTLSRLFRCPLWPTSCRKKSCCFQARFAPSDRVCVAVVHRFSLEITAFHTYNGRHVKHTFGWISSISGSSIRTKSGPATR